MVGTVKNSEETAVIPTVEIKIQDVDKIVTESYTLPTANPSKDIPFKIKFAQVSSENPVLEKPSISFVTTAKEMAGVEVVYDKTLVKHSDGHTSGFIINNSVLPPYGVKVYALIHGEGNEVIDVGKSVETRKNRARREKRIFDLS